MGFFDLCKRADIGRDVREYRATPGALLLDVRTPEEYCSGRIPGSVNVPLQSIADVAGMAGGRATPIFVCCQSGARSCAAARMLRQMGYENVKDIGGVCAYRRALEI